MKNKLRSLLAVSVVSAALFSCAGTRPIEKMVPEETAFYVQIARPDQFLSDMDLFLDSIDLLQTGTSSREMAEGFLLQAGPRFSPEMLDFGRPVGFAGLPGEGDGAFAFMLFIPLSKDADRKAAAQQFEADDSLNFVIQKDYLVLFSDKGVMENFPPKKPLDFGRFKDHSEGALHAYIDFGRFFDMLGLDAAQLKLAIEEGSPAASELNARIIDAYFGFFGRFESAWSYLSAGENGIETGGELYFRGSLRPVSGTRAFARHAEEGANLFTGIYNLDAADRQKITESFLSVFAEQNTDGQDFLREYLEPYREMNRAMGPRGAFSLDMSFDFAAMETGGALFSMHLAGVMELTDPELFESSLVAMFSGPGMTELLNSMYGETGITWDTALEKKRHDNAFDYLELTYGIGGGNEAAGTMGLPEEMKILYSIKEDLCYTFMSFGNPGRTPGQFLEELAAGSYPAENAEGAEWTLQAPDNANLVWNMRLKEYLEMVASAAGQPGFMLPDEPAGISGYLSAEETVSGRTFIPSQEILWLIGSFSMIRAGMLQ